MLFTLLIAVSVSTAYSVGVSTFDSNVVIEGNLDVGNSGVSNDWQSLTIHHSSNSGGGYFTQLDNNTSFIVVGGFDHAPTDRRIVSLGGGDWGVDDANEIQFWTDATYNGTINEGIKRVVITNEGNLEMINGYIQLDTVSGSPPSSDCDNTNEVGRMKVDSTGLTSNLFVCTPIGWAVK